MRLLSFGEILWDIYPDEKYIGGAPFNFAAHFARLGGETFMLTAVGRDSLGKEAVEKIKAQNVSTKYIVLKSEKDTGRCLVKLNENGVPQYDLLQDVAYDYIGLPYLKEKFDLLYFGTLALRNEYNITSLRKLIREKSFKDILVDVNIRPPFHNSISINFALSKATILKISDEELETVLENVKIENGDYKDVCRKLSKKFGNLKLIIITCGEKGSYCFDVESGKEYCCPSKAVKVVSTVGAGDSFFAAFVSEYFKSRDIDMALKVASKISGFVVSKAGAVPEYDKNIIQE